MLQTPQQSMAKATRGVTCVPKHHGLEECNYHSPRTGVELYPPCYQTAYAQLQ